MKIQKIVLKNFRGFSDLILEMNGQNVILVGKNGAGKSSLLDAIAVAFARFVKRVVNTKNPNRKLSDADITVGAKEVVIELFVEHDGENQTWTSRKTKGDGAKFTNRLRLKKILNELRNEQEVDDGKGVPLIAYYPVNRTVLDSLQEGSEEAVFNKYSAYERALTSGTDFRMFFEWYRFKEDIENEMKIVNQNFDLDDPQLEAVRQAIYAFLPGFSNLRVIRDPQQFVVKKGSKTLELNQLSDGEKCLLALVGDLARRLALANPDLVDPLQGQGVVLIDEIELHLHPEWQREVIPRLLSTFPNIQFIISTHSPQVLGETQDMSIYQLSPNENGIVCTPHPTVYGKDSNRILEDVMGSVLRNREIKRQLNELFDAITRRKWDEVEVLQKSLEEQIGTDEPELVKAEVLTRRMRSTGR